MFKIRSSRRTPGSIWRDAAWAFWYTPPILLAPFFILPFLMDFQGAMRSIAEAWQIYFIFFALPWALGIAAWVYARRRDQVGQSSE